MVSEEVVLRKHELRVDESELEVYEDEDSQEENREIEKEGELGG